MNTIPNDDMRWTQQLAQGPSEEFIMRQLALNHAVQAYAHLTSADVVRIAEMFYKFLSAEKEKP